jgi:sec-independent protein translocase protein TatA
MGALSIWHVLIAVGVGVLLLGGGRLAALMAEIGGGLGALRRGLTGDQGAGPESPTDRPGGARAGDGADSEAQ